MKYKRTDLVLVQRVLDRSYHTRMAVFVFFLSFSSFFLYCRVVFVFVFFSFWSSFLFAHRRRCRRRRRRLVKPTDCAITAVVRIEFAVFF
jgi:hypothetical protein